MTEKMGLSQGRSSSLPPGLAYSCTAAPRPRHPPHRLLPHTHSTVSPHASVDNGPAESEERFLQPRSPAEPSELSGASSQPRPGHNHRCKLHVGKAPLLPHPGAPNPPRQLPDTESPGRPPRGAGGGGSETQRPAKRGKRRFPASCVTVPAGRAPGGGGGAAPAGPGLGVVRGSGCGGRTMGPAACGRLPGVSAAAAGPGCGGERA